MSKEKSQRRTRSQTAKSGKRTEEERSRASSLIRPAKIHKNDLYQSTSLLGFNYPENWEHRLNYHDPSYPPTHVDVFGQSRESLNREFGQEFARRRSSSTKSHDSGHVEDQRFANHLDRSFEEEWNIQGKLVIRLANKNCSNVITFVLSQ
jgi:hypothetical protein